MEKGFLELVITGSVNPAALQYFTRPKTDNIDKGEGITAIYPKASASICQDAATGMITQVHIQLCDLERYLREDFFSPKSRVDMDLNFLRTKVTAAFDTQDVSLQLVVKTDRASAEVDTKVTELLSLLEDSANRHFTNSDITGFALGVTQQDLKPYQPVLDLPYIGVLIVHTHLVASNQERKTHLA
jgi:hypothetical protein